MSGLYLHIPFCKQACSYCDFYFVTKKDRKDHFVEELVDEIRSKKQSRFSEEKVHTIYFGGGTPSLLSVKQIEKILSAINEIFNVEAGEVTIEMNPDDVTKEYLDGLRSIGVNRASMGVQSFDQDLLTFMNRAHSRDEALKCMEALSQSGIDVFTVDLIYGNPGQTTEMLKKDIKTLLQFEPPHISAYSLTIEPRTRLGKQFELGRLVPPEDDVVARHFDVVVKELAKAGIEQYEVSNYAKPGSEAKHNSAYWNHVNYLGLGPGAHSLWWEPDSLSAYRWSNEPNLAGYLKGEWNQRFGEELLDLKTLAEERLMLGLRTTKGVSTIDLKEKYHFQFSERSMDYLRDKVQEGKVILGSDQIRLTTEGLKISDAILLDLITLD